MVIFLPAYWSGYLHKSLYLTVSHSALYSSSLNVGVEGISEVEESDSTLEDTVTLLEELLTSALVLDAEVLVLLAVFQLLSELPIAYRIISTISAINQPRL